MKYATVCSGIEAPSMAWHGLGWKPVWYSEIDRFPSAVLKHHYPHVPNLGDITKITKHETFKKSVGTVDLFCGGTPCQSFSVAGLRKGMDDPRGNLALVFLGIVDQLRPRWVVWENVPGVLSSNGGRDFGAFIGALGQLGYGWAYRILDAQYFGVPQRRRRVFVIGHIGGWQRAAAVLFERHSLQGHSAPRREAGEGFAASIGIRAANTSSNGKGISEELTHTLDNGPHFVAQITPTLCHGKKSAGSVTQQDAENGGLIVSSFKAGQGHNAGGIGYRIQQAPTLSAADSGSNRTPVVFWSIMPQNSGKDYKARKCEVTQPLTTNGHYAGNQGGDIIQNQMQVRRLTPRECERLQGFPDDFTKIPYRGKAAADCPDGPRYKALGNSMAVPVMEWIGKRIQMVDEL